MRTCPSRHIVQDMALLCHEEEGRPGRLHREADRDEP